MRCVLACVLVLCLFGTTIADGVYSEADVQRVVEANFRSQEGIQQAVAMHRAYQKVLDTFSFDFFEAFLPKFNVSAALNGPVCLLEQFMALSATINAPNPKDCNENLKEMNMGITFNILALNLEVKTVLQYCGFIQVLKNAVTTIKDIITKNPNAENCLTPEHLGTIAGQLRDALAGAVGASPAGKKFAEVDDYDSSFVEEEAREWEIPEHLGVKYHPKPSYHYSDDDVHETFLVEVGTTSFFDTIVDAITGLMSYLQGMMNRVGEAYGKCKTWNVKFGIESKLKLPPVVYLNIQDFNSVCALMVSLPDLAKDLAAKADEKIASFVTTLKDFVVDAKNAVVEAATAVKDGVKGALGIKFRQAQLRQHLHDIPITHHVLNYGAQGMLSERPVFIEYATMFLSGPHANKLQRITNFLETQEEMHEGLRSHLVLHQRALATALAETKGIVSTLMDAVQPLLRLPGKVMELFKGSGDQCTLYIPKATNFSQSSLSQFKMGFTLDLELRLPIDLPALHLGATDGFTLCKMIGGLQHFLESLADGSFEKEIIADLHTLYEGVKDAAGQVVTAIQKGAEKVGDWFMDAKKKLFGFKQRHGQQQLAPGETFHHYSRYVSPEVVFLQERFRLQKRRFFGLSDIWKKLIQMIEEPVTWVAKVFTLIDGGVKDCEQIIAKVQAEADKVGLKNVGEKMNFELNSEFQLPPSPMTKIFAVTVKDVKTVCILANAVRRIKWNKPLFDKF